jgi:peptide chain release factor
MRVEKIRRQKRRRSRKAREKILEAKQLQSEKKTLCTRISPDE